MAKLNHSLDIEISRQTRIRTLSIPVAGPFSPEADSHVITHGSGLNQWNTLSNPEFSSNQGFDIEEGRLRDAIPFNSDVSANNNTTSVKFAWIPQRGRLLLYIKATKIENTYLYYSIAENNLPPSKIKETKGQNNTVLICPRDEGIGDNEPMTITLWRTRENSSGSVYETSDRFTLWFHTYAEPKVRIAHPKNVDHSGSDDPIAQTEEAKNYPLIANEVINRLVRDDIKDVIYVCPVLSLMLSQDGLDDSGLGSYTRVSISEYKGTYGDNGSYTGTFHTPSNNLILNGTPDRNFRTGTWTGVFRDSDGSVISLSGMNEQALQWTPENQNAESVLIKDPNNAELNGWAEEQPHAWPETDGSRDRPLKADLRVCFRAGYKYKITVRRFHAYAAGFSENNARYSAYLYNARDTDYPCPHEAADSSIGELYYGPAPDFNIAKNNANNWNISSNPDTYMPSRNGHNKWVGPYGGENGATAPGFSDSETIIIDCVKTQTSRQNLVTIRPASQEVSADKWITFGYRHLNRTPDGFDGQKVLAKSGSAISDWILNYQDTNTNINYPDIKTDGSLRDEQTITQTEWNRIRTEDENWNTTNTAQTYNEKAPCIVTGSAYQNSWEGGPTTSLRACEMYVTLMSRAINELNKSESGSESLYTKFFKAAQAEFKKKTKCDSCGETNDVNIGDIKGKITISLVSGDTLLKIYEDDEIKYNDFKFNVTKTQNFILNFCANMIPGIEAPAPGTFSNEAWQIVCSKSYAYDVTENDDDTVNFSVGNYNATDPKGNEYTWLPIINAQDKTSLLPISKYMEKPMKEYADPNHLVPVNPDSHDSNYDSYLYAAFYNKIIHKEIDGTGASSLGNVHYSKFANLDKKRCISDNNTYDTSRSVNARDITSRPNPPYIWESNESNKIKNKDSDKEYTLKRKNFSTTEYNSFQYFATKNSNGTSLQEKPGKLFLRVPVGQDCENGNILPPKDGRLIPTRLDYNVPTARTSHLLFYRSHIRGRLRIDLEATATVSKISSHEDIVNEETGEVTGVNHSNTNLNVSKSQIYIMTNPGTGEYSSAISILDDVGKSVTMKTSPSDVSTIPNVLTVFGEDNNGLGRCLSANDYTSLNYIRSKQNGNWVTSVKTVSDYRKNTVEGTDHEGAIEVPIRVRYTPSAQPTISNDLNETLAPKSDSRTNVISLLQCYNNCTNKKWKIIEYDSARLDNDGMKFKEDFKVVIAYGLYNDKCKGSYKTVTNRECYTKQQMLQVGQVGMALPNTDYYPAVGICNGFAVILFPHNAKDSSGNIIDYFNKPKNWWSNRSNYESAYKHNEAKPVIIADKVVGKVYETYDSAKDENNKLATTYELSLNYTDLFLNNNVINNVNTSDTRANKAVINTWYDLVVVPIFSDNASLNGTRFKFEDGAGTINGAAYGGGASSATQVDTFYYGSNPMVIEKFVNFAQLGKVYKQVNDDGTLSSCGGGGGGGGEDPTDPTEPPFGVNGCILYPNVNNIKFNTKIGKVKECPGFWLNNTFRVIIRAPHFRPDSEISDENRAYGEQSIETVSNGKLTDSKDFIFTDVMIHFGKYDDVVKVKEDDGSIVNDNVGGINNIKFSDPKFQDMINRNQLNPEWLNARNIYTVRINPDAWSKRVPSINDLEPNVRDLVKAGSLDTHGSNYYDRMIEFNPNMVNAWTTDKEGFYIQVRFLNGEYATSSSIGTWSEWCGGIVDDSSQNNFKDKNLEYFVPIRSYNDVLTGFRNIQKEATPGAALLNTSDYSEALQGTGTLDGYKWVRGTGTSSRKENDSLTIVGRSVQEEGASPTNPKVIQSVGTTYIDSTVLYLRCGELTSQVILSEPLRNLTTVDEDDNADMMSELRTYRRVKCYSIPSSDLKLIESNTYEINLQDAFPIASDDSCPRMSTIGTVWDSTTEFSWKIQKKNGKAILTMKAPGSQTLGEYFQNTPVVGKIEFMYKLETPIIEKSTIPVELISSDLDVEVISEVSPTRIIIDKFNELSQSTAKYSQRGKTIHRSLLSDTYTVPAKTISKITAKDYNNASYTVVEENTDYPYKPGILKDITHTNNPAAEIPEEVIDNNQTYYEMNYIDYVITNMAKLYYTDYAEQKLPENNLTPKDFGWSAAKAVINQYKNWNNSVNLSDSSYTSMTSKSGNIVADKYFRKTITYNDFEELLEILKNLMRFTRDINWTGKHTTITSPTENNVTTGDNVIPVDEETLSLDALKMQDSDNPVKGIISNDINRPTHGSRLLPDYPDGVDVAWKDTEHNLIDRLWYLVKNSIIKDSIPDKNK